ncbi:antibiotic biosynthesis monooxygenase [Streptomyces sp. XM83C]|jgi:heme-degrading monooxygenase HmoA|nr:antibiotic biosynthesis monooxygenase family protein [Streptomyces sp. XM83C]MCK1823587.1 antibiotic biosynthesis monooxygenase [Streptomyces sp. XM83C]
MYTVMNRIAVPAAGAAAFEERFAASMRATLPGVDGLLGARLLRPQQEGGVYVAVMDFTDREAFAAWMRSESFRAAHGPSEGGAPDDVASGGVEMFETVLSVGA